MKGFIFTAGYGERLRPITDSVPKPLVPVMNIPALCWPLAALRRAGAGDLVCNLHHLHGAIIDFFNRNGHFDFNIAFSHEMEILGTGGGLKKCERLLGGEDFIVLNGDVVMDLDAASLLEQHRRHGALATVVLFRHPGAGFIGPVGVEGERVVDFKNYLGTGGQSEYIYTGAAALSPEIFRYLEGGFSSIVYTAYVEIIRRHRLDFFVHDGYWYDIGSPDSLYRVNMDFIDRAETLEEFPGGILGLEVEAVSDGAVIHREARVTRSIVGDGALVGRGAEVRNSVILPGARVDDGIALDGALFFGSGPLSMTNS